MTRNEARAIFQISPTASADEIKSRFRDLSRDIHPDKHPNNATIADLYSRVSTAYSILTGDMEPDPEPEESPSEGSQEKKKGPPAWVVRAAEVAADRQNRGLIREIAGDDDAADLFGIFARSFLSTLRKGK